MAHDTDANGGYVDPTTGMWVPASLIRETQAAVAAPPSAGATLGMSRSRRVDVNIAETEKHWDYSRENNDVYINRNGKTVVVKQNLIFGFQNPADPNAPPQMMAGDAAPPIQYSIKEMADRVVSRNVSVADGKGGKTDVSYYALNDAGLSGAMDTMSRNAGDGLTAGIGGWIARKFEGNDSWLGRAVTNFDQALGGGKYTNQQLSAIAADMQAHDLDERPVLTVGSQLAGGAVTMVASGGAGDVVEGANLIRQSATALKLGKTVEGLDTVVTTARTVKTGETIVGGAKGTADAAKAAEEAKKVADAAKAAEEAKKVADAAKATEAADAAKAAEEARKAAENGAARSTTESAATKPAEPVTPIRNDVGGGRVHDMEQGPDGTWAKSGNPESATLRAGEKPPGFARRMAGAAARHPIRTLVAGGALAVGGAALLNGDTPGVHGANAADSNSDHGGAGGRAGRHRMKLESLISPGADNYNGAQQTLEKSFGVAVPQTIPGVTNVEFTNTGDGNIVFHIFKDDPASGKGQFMEANKTVTVAQARTILATIDANIGAHKGSADKVALDVLKKNGLQAGTVSSGEHLQQQLETATRNHQAYEDAKAQKLGLNGYNASPQAGANPQSHVGEQVNFAGNTGTYIKGGPGNGTMVMSRPFYYTPQ